MVTRSQEPRERENSESKEEVRPCARAASAASLPARWNAMLYQPGVLGREEQIRTCLAERSECGACSVTYCFLFC